MVAQSIPLPSLLDMNFEKSNLDLGLGFEF